MKPKYIVLAGVNGAGKSTLFQSASFFNEYEFINTDVIAKGIGAWSEPSVQIAAGKLAVRKVREMFAQRKSFCQETTLCGKSILRNIQRAKENGYEVQMFYVGIGSPEFAKDRVHTRVKHGGHGVPDQDIERRYYESLKNVPEILSVCDLVVLYDNTELLKTIAIYCNGVCKKEAMKLPDWYRTYIR